jgi:hypothetical protein
MLRVGNALGLVCLILLLSLNSGFAQLEPEPTQPTFSDDIQVPEGNPDFNSTPTVMFNDEPPNRVFQRSLERKPPPNYVPKQAGHYTAQDWATAIDTMWGPGISDSLKGAYFKSYWEGIVGKWFACFDGLSGSVYDSIYNLYWPDPPVNFDYSGVSKGRYAGIIQQASFALLEAHQNFYDYDVATTDWLPGVPLMNIGQHYIADHFGAGVTALADSTVLVYKVAQDHPFGLEPGDQIIGYDDIPWHDLVDELVAAEMPVSYRCRVGSTEPTRTHRYLMSAGMNWHLFDTIDIYKYSTGDTVHFPTEPLVDLSTEYYASEQLDVYGIDIPQYNRVPPEQASYLSWGVMDGTDIGYIYCQGWFALSSNIDSAWVVDEWAAILDTLKEVDSVSGLIIDLRLNIGANFNFWDVVAQFFSDTVEAFRVDQRCNATDHYALCPASHPFFAPPIIAGDSSYFDRPVAILTGPNAESGGDLFPVMMSLRPNTKFFGLPTCGAFSGTLAFGNWRPGFNMQMAGWNVAYLGPPERHLSHAIFPSEGFDWVDYQEVWLTPEGVSQGQDDVVEAAIEWIRTRCCVALTGNVDNDPDGLVDIGDLTALISYLYIPPNPEPLCPDEANIDGDPDGLIDIGDLTALISYLYIPPNPEPAACP